MEFEEFKYLIEKVQESSKKRHEVSKFFESNLTTSSFVYFNFGEDLEAVIVNMLADYYKCWWTGDGTLPKDGTWYSPLSAVYYSNNDIEWWLYEDVDKKICYSDGRKSVDVEDIKDFYNYLENRYNPVNL